MILRSVELVVFGTVPRGDVRNGPIKNSSLEREKGPVYRPRESSLWMWDVTCSGYRRAELWLGGV